jgi:hypothetical protein
MPPPASGSAAGVTGPVDSSLWRHGGAGQSTSRRLAPYAPGSMPRRGRRGDQLDGAPPGGSPHPLLGSVGTAVRPVSRGTLDDSTVVNTAAFIRQRMVRPMPSRQQAPQGRMSSGGTPASASALLGRTNQALRAAGDPVAEVSLRDGLTVYLRPVRAEDAAAIRRLFQGLSETSTWLRFFSTCPSLDRVVDWGYQGRQRPPPGGGGHRCRQRPARRPRRP